MHWQKKGTLCEWTLIYRRTAWLIGRKIGINYIGQTGELRGCINDVKNIRNFIICKLSQPAFISCAANLFQAQYGYKSDDIVVLTDDASDSRRRPTRNNIVSLSSIPKHVIDSYPITAASHAVACAGCSP